jgi:hypothetical protein
MGEYYRQEMKDFMDADIYFNLSEDELSRVYDTNFLKLGRQFFDVYYADVDSNKVGPNYACFNIATLAMCYAPEKKKGPEIF